MINGQKIWTSYGHIADYCEMLVRTDPEAPKHKGITWLIVPMDTPGIDIRPLETMRGHREFCEVFFDDVRVPVAQPGRRRERRLARRDGDASASSAAPRSSAIVLESMRAGARPRRPRQDGHQPRRAALGGRRLAPRDRSHRRRVRRAVGAHQAQRLAGATRPGSSASAARCSSSRTPTCASSSATSPCACSTARRCRSTTSPSCPTAGTCSARLYALSMTDRRRHVADPTATSSASACSACRRSES